MLVEARQVDQEGSAVLLLVDRHARQNGDVPGYLSSRRHVPRHSPVDARHAVRCETGFPI